MPFAALQCPVLPSDLPLDWAELAALPPFWQTVTSGWPVLGFDLFSVVGQKA